jgi:ATP-dependent helicase IRC3
MKVIIVDEAHHATAPSYLRILSYFNPLIAGNLIKSDTDNTQLGDDVPIVGFSATFSRHDGLALGKVFQEIVYHQDFQDMIQDNWYATNGFVLFP